MGCKIITKTDSLQGKAIQFLLKNGVQNINEVLNESSITVSNSSKFKNLPHILSMLEDVSDTFKKHGLFVHKGDQNIVKRNADFLENLVDEKRLVTRINNKAKELGFKHNVISSNQFQGKYWLVTSDSKFSDNVSFQQAEERRRKIIERNLEYIDRVNAHFKSVTGREGIKVTSTKNAYIIEFNKSVLNAFNAESYTHYVNSMYKYLNNNEVVEEDLVVSPLLNKLKVERHSLTKDKEIRESQGAKKSIINELDNRIKEIEETLNTLKTTATLEDVWDEAGNDFIRIDKILNQDELSPAEFNRIARILNGWIVAGDFSKETHPYLDEEEYDNKFYRDKFTEIRSEAEKRNVELIKKGDKLLESSVNKSFGLKDKNRISIDKILKLTNRVNLGHKYVSSLNRVGNPLAQFIHKVVNEANNRASIESIIASRKLAEIYQKVKNSGFDLNKFYQRTENGSRTGNLINKFSSKFYRDFKSKIYPFVNNYRDNMFFIDPSKLSDEEYKKEIITHLGEKEANKHFQKALDKYDEYLEIKQEFINQEFGKDRVETKEEQDILDNWIRDNSPIQRIYELQNTKNRLTKDVRGKDTFIVAFPRRFHKDLSLTEWYDETYNEIEDNDTAYELYNAAQDILSMSNINFGGVSFNPSSLAYVKKSLMEQYHEHGIVDFLTKDVYDNMVKSVITSDAGAVTTDPLTGKQVKTINNNVTGLNTLIKEKYGKLLESWQQTHPDEALTEEVKSDLYNQASEEVFSNTGDNLFLSLNLMNLANLSLKHKYNIEDHVNLAMTYLPNTDFESGNEYLDSKGNPLADRYINNMMEMVDNFLNMSYYGINTPDTSAALFKVKNREDKTRAREIRQELTNPELSDADRAILEKELSELGSNVTLNAVAKKFLDFIRIKGLGWNIPAGIANIFQGKSASWFKAADGRLFNMKELGQAEKLVLTQNKKFNSIIENYSILGDILFEYKQKNKFEEKKNWFFKAIKSLKPYAIQTSTEKLNQGTVAIAMMLRQKVSNKKTGETKSMWEAISDQGELGKEWEAEGKTGEDAVIETVSKIKSTVEEIFGDYTNPMMIKNTVVGRSLGMYKMWVFEAIMNRVASERHDYIRGITYKGRYRTAIELMKQYRLNFRKAFQEKGNWSEIDQANMRMNLIEIAGIVATYALYSLLKGQICGDDKNCSKANAAQMFTLNMSKRVFNEVSFYLSPPQWKQFISNPTAAANILTDATKLIEYVQLRLDDDPDNHLYLKGRNEGRDKGVVLFESQIPMLNQLKRLKSYGQEILNL